MSFRIERFLRLRSITITELASRAGISRCFLSLALSHQVQLSPSSAHGLSKAIKTYQNPLDKKDVYLDGVCTLPWVDKFEDNPLARFCILTGKNEDLVAMESRVPAPLVRQIVRGYSIYNEDQIPQLMRLKGVDENNEPVSLSEDLLVNFRTEWIDEDEADFIEQSKEWNKRNPFNEHTKDCLLAIIRFLNDRDLTE